MKPVRHPLLQHLEAGRLTLSPVWNLLRQGGLQASDFILPPVCISCRGRIICHGQLCAACWSKINFIAEPLCDALGLPLPYDAGENGVSAAAIANPPVYDRARAVARFDDQMRQLVHGLKYKDQHGGVKMFGRWMSFAGRHLLTDADLLIPVPLFPLKLWSRRFNQASLLANAVSLETGVRAAHRLLLRKKRTRTQVGLSHTERRRNVAGAFHLSDQSRRSLRDKNIVLIDDVITSGATSDACARTLLKGGAARVDVVALARVSDPLFFNV